MPLLPRVPVRNLLVGFAISFWLVIGHTARADEITIAPSQDTTLYEQDGSLGNGAGEHLFVGRTGQNGRRRALIAFDVAAALPDGTKIGDAELRLALSRSRTGTLNVSLHRLTASWGEGASDSPGNGGGGVLAAIGDATWSHRLWNTEAWTSPGGDFLPTSSATTKVDTTEKTYGFTGDRFVADVQSFLDEPSKNFGWVLVGEEDGARLSKRFESRTANPAAQPALRIAYTTTVAAGACCAANGSCSIRAVPGTTCAGSYLGAATSCTPNLCPPPTGACCTPDSTATCTTTAESACSASKGEWQGALTTCGDDTCPVVLTPYVDALPLPSVATPAVSEAGAPEHYRIRMVQTKQKLHRDLPTTTVWGFDDGKTGPGYPGPTIEAHAGTPIRVTWVNDLRDEAGALRTTHFLPVDSCPHGASSDAPRTVIHLHGGHVPSEFDGQPEMTLLPGQESTYEYPNAQLGATLWYHDHALGITRLNVIMGLAGFYLLHDDREKSLNLPSGKYDVPLVIQDRSFRADGTFRYPATWQEHFFGDTALVNGKVWPRFDVDRGLYRFRLLNGSTSRTYTLSMGQAFQQIATDGGLMANPVATSSLTLAPGERAEIIVDFSKRLAGEEIVLENRAAAPFPNGDQMHALPHVMKFVVGDAVGSTTPPPLDLRPVERIDESVAVETRDFALQRQAMGCGGAMWMINGKHWDEITERPHLGTTEVWRFVNRSGIMHPMHIHLVMFQVLDHQRFVMNGDEVVPSGDRVPPPSSEKGWKDTVQVAPFEIVRVIATFQDYAGKFPYHCHILEHEDHEMMRQFEAIAVCGDGALARGLEECDDGNALGGDGCSSECKREPDGGAGGARDLDAGAGDAAAPLRDAGRKRPASSAPPERRGGCSCGLTTGSAPNRWASAGALLSLCGLMRRRGSGRHRRRGELGVSGRRGGSPRRAGGSGHGTRAGVATVNERSRAR